MGQSPKKNIEPKNSRNLVEYTEDMFQLKSIPSILDLDHIANSI